MYDLIGIALIMVVVVSISLVTLAFHVSSSYVLYNCLNNDTGDTLTHTKILYQVLKYSITSIILL